MFNDLLTFCINIHDFRGELIDKGYTDESGEPVLPLLNRTPTQNRNSPRTTSYVRCRNDEEVALLYSFGTLEVLGTKEEVDADPEKTAKYESAYSREPYTVTDPETGEEITNTPPYWHGAFA